MCIRDSVIAHAGRGILVELPDILVTFPVGNDFNGYDGRFALFPDKVGAVGFMAEIGARTWNIQRQHHVRDQRWFAQGME